MEMRGGWRKDTRQNKESEEERLVCTTLRLMRKAAAQTNTPSVM